MGSETGGMQKADVTIVTSTWKEFFCKRKISWPVYSLVVLFGLGSWIAVNGLWVELPVLVKNAPEGWNLPSYLAVIFQLANVGPVIYSIGNHFFPKRVNEKSAITLIIIMGAVSCALLGFYWDKTSSIGGRNHSTVLFILSFFLAIVDCTSSVAFLTFMSIFPSSYITALFVGETSSGLLPAFVALGQGINSGSRNHNSNVTNNSSGISIQNAEDDGLKFGPDGFFFFLFSIMVVCGLAFLALNVLPIAKRQHVGTIGQRNQPKRDCHIESDPLVDDSLNATQSFQTSDETTYDEPARCEITLPIVYLLFIQGWINCLSNGVLPSVSAYASEPYGNETYHLVATLSSIASALTCFAALWIPCSSNKIVTILSSVYTILAGFTLVLASLSPTPPLYNTALGSVIIILVSIVCGILVSYTKLSICTTMRNHGYRALFWCGVSIQTGSCVGALIMFPLVNILKLFHQAKS
ncbi:solute carrier family 52, riboflavin transporter, member 3-B-like [Montipora capricornis]|uniref:solute carrier family 52, riboflavin transporter, member 3-B-like n=1 Tax=Montipora capricornis TaxID=246305 RepID=UPI0035F1E184